MKRPFLYYLVLPVLLFALPAMAVDTDGDGVDDTIDNCPAIANVSQLNTDGDTEGDACDDNDDNDAVPDLNDSFPKDTALTEGHTNILYKVVGKWDVGVGEAVVSAGDVNGDGYQDIVLGRQYDNQNGWRAGAAVVLSGINGEQLHIFYGDSEDDQFGGSVSGAGDVNNDGYADIIVGASHDDNNGSSSGSARVFSGLDSSVLYTFNGNGSDNFFGHSVAGVGDINQDGYADIAVGAPSDDNNSNATGSVRIFSGIDGSALFTFYGQLPTQYFGFSIKGVGDLDADGYPDVGIAGNDYTLADNYEASVQIYSGKTGNLLHTFYGDGYSYFEYDSFFDAAGDVNQDGYMDVAVGASNHGEQQEGVVLIYSGKTGLISRTYSGDAQGDGFGIAVANAGDVNNDGYDDVMVGTPRDNNNGYYSGTAKVFSGIDGAVLYVFDGSTGDNYLGESVAGLGDINGDGYGDVVVRASDSYHSVWFGSIVIYSGKGLWTDTDGDGQNDAIDLNDDNDGALDIEELFPVDSNRLGDQDFDAIDGSVDNCFGFNPDQLDTDGDLLGDACDTDDDNDGIADIADSFPKDGIQTGGNTNILFLIYGNVMEPGKNMLGMSVSNAGDVNADGYDDVIAGAACSVTVASGQSGATIHSLDVCATGTWWVTVSGAGDINQDGYADFMVGAPGDGAGGYDAGSVSIYSGMDGSVLYAFQGEPNTRFGASISDAGDVNNDGYPDVVIGSDNFNAANFGAAHIYSGSNGTLLYIFQGDGAQDSFGASVSGAGDVNNDGYADVIVGAPDADNNGSSSGIARIFSGKDGAILYTLNGSEEGEGLGISVSDANDINQDGYADVVVGAFRAANPYGEWTGGATVFSGLNGDELFRFYGDGGGDYFGYAVSSAEDVNQDGYPDIIVGALLDDNVGGWVENNSGSARILSGKDGAILYAFDGDNAGDSFGVSVSVAGDVNNDGYADVIVGIPYADNAGENAGMVRVFSGKGLWTDADGDTQNDAVDNDDDNDGIVDASDAFPLDSSESLDTDGDGIGNNTDWDDDGDGVPDVVDADPLNAGDTSEIILPLDGTYKGSVLKGNNAPQ